MTKKVAILVAVGMLAGGLTVKDKFVPFSVKDGEELTPDKIEKLGLTKADVDDLKERGAIMDVDVRAAEDGDADASDTALAAALDRAEKAEGEVKTLTDKVAELEKDLAEATKPKAAAA
jgi:uncharacterized protein (UPF0335 family)